MDKQRRHIQRDGPVAELVGRVKAGRSRPGEEGATTLEYLLIVSLFSVPLSIFVGGAIRNLLREVITKIVESFTAG